MSGTTKTFIRLVGMACAGVLVFAACSSDDSDDNSQQESPITETPRPSETSESPDAPEPPESEEAIDSPDGSDDGGAEETPDNPIPKDAVEYADALVIAWGSGDLDRVTQLAADDAVDALHEYGEAGGPHWDQTAHDAGAGSVFVTYENSEDGTVLELRVANEAASAGEAHAVVEVKFNN